MEKFAISRLVGAPPGYVGYEEGGQLTEKVRRKPYAVILLDEIEKAHPDVFNMLLQVLDDGHLTDSLGRKIDFIENALKKSFAPEFLNRIDDVVVFNPLEKDDINKIIDIELEKLLNRINSLGYILTITDSAKSFIADKGFDKQYGARPLKRAIQKYIEDALAEEIVASNLKEGDKIKIDLDKKSEELTIKIEKSEKPKES